MKPVPVLGIDFGTTTSTACLMAGDREVFIVPEGDAQDSLMPSIVFFTGAGDQDYVVGLPAIKKLTGTRDSRNVVQHIKREMMLDAEWLQLSPRQQKKHTFHGRSYRPAEIAGRIIGHLKRAAERQLENDRKLSDQFSFQGSINTAVITVPAQFGARERQSTRQAALSFGGFHEVHLLEEPVAAALGLRLHEESGRKIVMIVDLGGGTLDVTLLCVGQQAPGGGFHELGRIGDNELGGTDWDRVIARYVMAAHCDQSDIREILVNHLQALRSKSGTTPDVNSTQFKAELDQVIQQVTDVSRNFLLQQKCEEAKIAMGNPRFNRPHAMVSYKDASLERIDDRAKWVEVQVPVNWFRETTQILSDWCAQRCSQLLTVVSPQELRKAGLKELTWKQVDQIVLVGGGSRLPAVQAAIAKVSGKQVKVADSAQHLVAMGAARYAEMRRNRNALEGIGIPRSPRTFGVIQKVAASNSNGNSSFLQRWLPLGKRVHNGHTTSEDLQERFSTIINTSQASDEAVTCTYQLANPNSREFLARILENRFTRHHPDGQLYHVSDLRIPQLPPPQSGQRDEVVVTMNYGDDHKLRASAVCRGKSVEVEVTERSIQERAIPYKLK